MPFFLEVQFDPLLSSGTKGRTTYNTLVIGNPANGEVRYQLQSRGYYKVTINLADRSRTQMDYIQQFWDNVMGKTYGFRWRNRLDYQAINESIVALTPTTGQLVKTRTYGGNTVLVPIKKVDLVKPITLKRDGIDWPYGDWTYDTTTGIVYYNTSQTGHTIIWTGEYDIPVRFDVDSNTTEWKDFDIFDWSEVNLLEYAL